MSVNNNSIQSNFSCYHNNKDNYDTNNFIQKFLQAEDIIKQNIPPQDVPPQDVPPQDVPPQNYFSQNILPPIPYRLEDVENIRICLSQLYNLESAKHANLLVNIRTLLFYFLHERHNVTHFLFLNELQRNSLKRLNNGNKLILSKVEFKNHKTPAKSIRILLNKFLTSDCVNKNNCGIYEKTEKATQKNRTLKKRFFAPAYKIPIIELLFLFNDGHDFSHVESQKNKHRLPRRQDGNHKFVYLKVLEGIQEILNEMQSHSSASTIAASIEYKLDNIFLHCRLNILLNYYKRYTSNEFMDKLIKKLRLPYNDILILKDVLVQQIFQDENFILSGLQSNFLDFMLPFDILIQKGLLTSFYNNRLVFHTEQVLNESTTENTEESSNETSDNKPSIFISNLIEDLQIIKNDTLLFLNTLEDGQKSERLPSDSLDEKTITSILKENAFYKVYSSSLDNDFISLYKKIIFKTTKEEDSIISLIMKALQHTTR